MKQLFKQIMYLPTSLIIIGITLLILYFNCIINLKHIYIQTEQVTNKINQYTYAKTVNNKTYQ